MRSHAAPSVRLDAHRVVVDVLSAPIHSHQRDYAWSEMTGTRILGALFITLAFVHGAISMVRALRAWRRGEKYVGSWMDGSLLKGRAIDPRIMVGIEVILLGVIAYLGWAAVTGRLWSKPFVFRAPIGWIDVSERAPLSNLAHFSDDAQVALRGGAKLVSFLAAHPIDDTEGGVAMFSGLRRFGSSRVDDRTLDEVFAEGFDAPAEKMGARATRIAQSMTLVAGRSTGTIEIELAGQDAQLRPSRPRRLNPPCSKRRRVSRAGTSAGSVSRPTSRGDESGTSARRRSGTSGCRTGSRTRSVCDMRTRCA